MLATETQAAPNEAANQEHVTPGRTRRVREAPNSRDPSTHPSPSLPGDRQGPFPLRDDWRTCGPAPVFPVLPRPQRPCPPTSEGARPSQVPTLVSIFHVISRIL